jgi:bacterioferritin
MEHAERITGRLLALGCAPNASQLRPTRLSGQLMQLIEHAMQLESEIIGLYQQATEHCRKNQDHEHYLFFETLLKEEQQHHDEMVVWKTKLSAGVTADFR